MDIFSDQVLKDYIRKNPELVLWMHNNLASLKEALLVFADSLHRRYIEKEAVEIPGRGALDQIEAMVGLIERPYFAAFEHAAEAEEFIKNSQKTGQRKRISGGMAKAGNLDRLSLQNILNDTRKLLAYGEDIEMFERDGPQVEHLQTPEKYIYPSGQVAFRQYSPIDVAPMTGKGIELASTIVSRLADAGYTSKPIQQWLENLQAALDSNDEIELEKLQESLQEVTAMAYSLDDLREMYGVNRHIYYQDLDEKNYPYDVALRKKVIEKIEPKHPEQVAQLANEMFFFLEMTDHDFYALSGFGKYHRPEPVINDAGARYPDEEPRWRIRRWEDIIQDTKLSIFGIDATKVSSQELRKIRQLYEQHERSNLPAQEDMMAELAQIKRIQKAREKIVTAE